MITTSKCCSKYNKRKNFPQSGRICLWAFCELSCQILFMLESVVIVKPLKNWLTGMVV